MRTKRSKISKSVDESSQHQSPNFITAITRIAVAQICQSIGYQASQQSALETLTDIASRYLQSIAKSAAASAISTGRTQSNYLDVVISLEELHSSIGFNGNSNVNRSIYSSSIVVDIMKFVNYSREIPFAKPVPRRKNSQVIGLSLTRRVGDVCGKNHIPKWLPAFPEMRREVEKKVNGEERWGVIQKEEEKVVEKEGKKGEMEIDRKGEEGMKEVEMDDRKREKVRFKLGKEAKGMELVKNGGVCKGGKRIMCQL